MSPCECALSKQALLTDLVERIRFWEGKKEEETHINKGTDSTFLRALAPTKCHHGCSCFLSKCIAVLHHLHLLRWGSQSPSSSAMENPSLETWFFTNRSSLVTASVYIFTNLSTSIKTNLLKLSPVWVELNSSRAHLNINVGAAYVMIYHVVCLDASSHQMLKGWKALCSQIFTSSIIAFLIPCVI